MMLLLAFVILWLAFTIPESVSYCEMGNEIYNKGQVWTDTERCVGYTCWGDRSFNMTQCSDLTFENWKEFKMNSLGNSEVFPSCCSESDFKHNTTYDLQPCQVEGQTVDVGEQHNFKGQCFQYICLGNEKWTVRACALEGSPAGWHFVTDDSKPYPECCGEAVPLLNVTPDVLDHLPHMFYLDITYHSDIGFMALGTTNHIFPVDKGNGISPLFVKKEPAVNYTADPAGHYLLAMVDADAAGQNVQGGELLHWLVGNIPGNNVSAGQELASYSAPWPPEDTGAHRYFFFLYKQPDEFHLEDIKLTTLEQRDAFSVRDFSKKYNLGDPVGMNVFQSTWHLELRDLERNCSPPDACKV